MSSSSDATPTVPLEDTGAFELTDLGACSYLDEPSEQSDSFSPRSLTDNLSACVTSGNYRSVGETCPPDASSSGCSAPGLPAARDPGAVHSAAHAFAQARRRGTGALRVASVDIDRPSGAETVMRGRALVGSPSSGSPLVSAKEVSPAPPTTSALSASAGALTVPHAQRPDADRLDAALMEFLGDEVRMRKSHEELALIYGGVFDPEVRAAELNETERSRLATGSHKSVADDDDTDFAWDDDELDAPIDPDDVRRRVGSRADGVPQFGILRRNKRRTADSEEQ